MYALAQTAPSLSPRRLRKSLNVPVALSLLAHALVLAVLVQWSVSSWRLPAAHPSAAPVIELQAARTVVTAATTKPAPPPPLRHRIRSPRQVERMMVAVAAAPPAADAALPLPAAPPAVEAPPPAAAGAATVAALDQGDIKPATAALPVAYLLEVSRIIQRNLNYPYPAKRDGARGIVVVHIVLERDGTVLAVEVLQGIQRPELDGEARDVVLRIHKFPQLPPDVIPGEARFAIDQPIGFGSG